MAESQGSSMFLEISKLISTMALLIPPQPTLNRGFFFPASSAMLRIFEQSSITGCTQKRVTRG